MMNFRKELKVSFMVVLLFVFGIKIKVIENISYEVLFKLVFFYILSIYFFV